MVDKKSNNNGSNKRILIIGGAGFLGANLVRRVLQEEPNAKVIVVDSLEPAMKSTRESLAAVVDKIEFIQGDIRDAKLLEQAVPGQDIIFNCAAQTSHSKSLEDPIFDADVNCIGNLRLLVAVRDHNPEAVVVYPSSSTVVGKAVSDVIDEDHGEKPLDIYSASKGAVEKYYRVFHNVYGIKTVVLRFANLYGPFGKNDPSFGFVNYFINQAAAGKPIKLFGDGHQTRNVMFVDDATDILWRAANDPRLIGEMYFATHQDHRSVKEIAEVIVKVFNKSKLEMVPWPDIRKRIELEKVFISAARLHHLIGWKPRYSLEEGLQLTKERMAQADY
jgi:UDP-glucose 4-epimerase